MLTEFERKAWDSRGQANSHPPEMALKAALDQIERGEFKRVRHCIVVVIERRETDDGDFICTLQAGDMSELAVEGALFRAAHITRKHETEG